MVMTMTMTMTMMVTVMQLKRHCVPEGIYFWLQRKWENFASQKSEKDGEEFAPTKYEPEVAGEFPLHL